MMSEGDAPPIEPNPSGVPSDNTTLSAVLASFEVAGYTGQLVPQPGGLVRCSLCGTSTPASRLVIERARRLEGASDPDDMMRVIAARCGSCHRGGTMILGFGVNASEVDVDVATTIVVPAHVTDAQ